MSTTNLARNRQLAMQAKLSTSDESMRQLLNDWLMGHEAFDRYDAQQRAQLVVDLQALNGLSGIGASDWHITAAALACSLVLTDDAAISEWLFTDELWDADGNAFAHTGKLVKYWDNVAVARYQFFVADSAHDLLADIDRMVDA